MTLASQVLPAEGYLITSIVDYIPSEFIMAVKFHQILGFVLALVFGLIFAYHIGKRTGRRPAVPTETEEHTHNIQSLLDTIDTLEGVCRIQKEEFVEALDEKEKKIKEKDDKILELGMELNEVQYKLDEMGVYCEEQKSSYERELETAENAMVVWRDTAATSAHEANAAQLERDHYRRRARTLQNWPCYYTRHGDRWHLYQDCQALNQSEPMCKDMLCRFCGQRLMAETGNLAAMTLGFLVGSVVRALQLEQEEALLNFRGSFFFYVLLPPIIFEAGLSLKTQLFVDNLGSILAFAVVGTLISTWVVSASMRWAAETQLIGLQDTAQLPIYCHLFGALISATDPVATIALFGSSRFRTDPLLHSLINGESVLNDAVAIVLFSTLTHHMQEEEPRLISIGILGHFGIVLVGSVIMGVAAGAMLSWCFSCSNDLTRFPDYEIAGMFLGAYLTFAVTQLFGLSGITALFCFGVVLAHYNWYNLSEPSKVASKVIFGTIAKLAEAGVFVYLGVVAALSLGRFHWHGGCILFALLAITVARAAHVFPLSVLLNLCRRTRKITNNTSVVMWVSGLRGAIAFALSLRVPCEGETLRAQTVRTSHLRRVSGAVCAGGAMFHALSTLCNKKSISKIWRRSALEEHQENFTPNPCKTVLCWLGALMIMASESLGSESWVISFKILVDPPQSR
eukprot:s2473_g3.t3